MAVRIGAEMLDVARMDRGNRHHDQHVGGAERMVDHGAVAAEGAEPQIALDQRRQRARSAARGSIVAFGIRFMPMRRDGSAGTRQPSGAPAK